MQWSQQHGHLARYLADGFQQTISNRSLASRSRSFSPFSSEKTFNAAFSTDRCDVSDSILLKAEAAAFLHGQLFFFLMTPHIRFDPRRTS